MKIFALPVLLVVLALCSSCNNDVNDFNPDKDPLTGMVGGEDWTYGSGNASYEYFSGDYTGIILDVDLDDPCTRVPGGVSESHLVVRFPAQRGNYNLPYINNTGNTAEVIFDLPDGKRYTATAGFLEIVQITSTDIVGFISADYDEESNYVEGAFILRICN